MSVLNDICSFIIILQYSLKEFNGEHVLLLYTPHLSSHAPLDLIILHLRLEFILRVRCRPRLLMEVLRKLIGILVWLYFCHHPDRDSHKNLWCILTTPRFIIEWRVFWNTCHVLQMISNRQNSHQQLWCANLLLSGWWNPIQEAPPEGPILLQKVLVLPIVEGQRLKFPMRAGQLKQPNWMWKEVQG